ERLEFAPQLPVVVDAPVERQRQAEGRVDHRLLRVLRQVDDAQAPVRQRDRTLLECARRIGTTGLEDVAHPGDRADVGAGRVETSFACKTAHRGRYLSDSLAELEDYVMKTTFRQIYSDANFVDPAVIADLNLSIFA